jgi:predicted nucleotidyltransferase
MGKERLNKIERKALEDFKNRLLEKFRKRLILIKLYGSRARGERHIYSDVDLLLVVRKRTKKFDQEVLALECEISEKYGYRDHLAPMIMSLAEYKWQKRRQWPFILTVEEDGIDLWKKSNLKIKG